MDSLLANLSTFTGISAEYDTSHISHKILSIFIDKFEATFGQII